MRSYPEDADGRKDLAKLKVARWMADLLKLNPDYPHWGPHEDYMWVKGNGWNAPIIVDSWKQFNDGEGMMLDDYNECVHFYFEVNRASRDCTACERSGYNPQTHQLQEDWYDFAQTGRRWCDKLTQEEVDVLVARGRLGALRQPDRKPTAEEVNAANRGGGGMFGDFNHDAINAWIALETRAKRLGFYGKCETCKGAGYLFTEPKGHVGLVLWMLHPRKGASRGVEVKRIDQDDLPTILAWLNKAAKRNAQRFDAVVREAKKNKKAK